MRHYKITVSDFLSSNMSLPVPPSVEEPTLFPERDDDHDSFVMGDIDISYNSDVAALEYMEMHDNNPQELPDDFQTVPLTDGAPDVMRWKFDPMYRTSANGSVWVWQTGFDGVSTWVLFGPVSSTSITTTTVVTKAERTLSEQAFIICKKMHMDKYRDVYLYLEDDRPQHIKAMKGYEYSPGCITIYPVAVDWKLNGIRATCRVTGGITNILSYNNTSLNHVDHVAKNILDFMAFLPDSCMVDGELYKHGLAFSQIQSIVGSRVNKHPDLHTISYYIFDIYYPANPVIEERYTTLVSAYNSYCEMVGNTTSLQLIPKKWVNSETEMMEEYGRALACDAEGLVIRQCSINREPGSKEWMMSMYVPGRSKALLKLKPYTTDEGVVIGVRATKGKEKNMCKIIVRTRIGYDLPVRFGSAREKEEWRRNPSLILGKVLMYKYSSTHYRTGVPQIAVGLGIRHNFA